MSSNHRAQDHRIRRLVFDLACPDEATAFRVRQRLEDLAFREVVPALEAVFDACAPPDRTVRIERLELDLGTIAADDWDWEVLRRALAAQIMGRASPWEPRMSSSVGREAVAARSLALVEAVVAFLETGVWPWDAPCRTLAEAEAALRSLAPEEAQLAATRLLAAVRPAAPRRRLAYQFAAGFAEWLVRLAHGQAADALMHAGQTWAAALSPVRYVEALLAVASALPAGHTPLPLAVQRLGRASLPLSPEPDPQGVHPPAEAPDAPPAASEAADVAADQGLYVELAGIILLHPFLARFFAHLGLLGAREQFRSFEARVRGVHLLHYLAAGQENPAEPVTVLLKVLCGLPISAPLPRELRLSEEERAEAESLLRAAIGHWAKLGNTSPAGLRETFLQREGRLTRSDASWRLTVEQRSVDLLLGYLPWNLSPVRLPWMGVPLFVDWA